MYSWSTELDGTGRRVLVEHNQLAMYPVLISVEAARALFVQLAQASHELEHRPRFYNTLTDNCTSELARGANRLQPHVIPFNRALIFPRYAVPELARLGFLPTDVPAAALPARYAISDLVAEYAVSPDFSEQLRRHLPRPVA